MIVKEIQGQKWMFTYDLEGNFFFDLYCTAFRRNKCISLCKQRSTFLCGPASSFALNFSIFSIKYYY